MSSIHLPHEIDAALRRVRRRSRLLDAGNGLLLSAAALLAATLIAIGIDSLVVLFHPLARSVLTITALASACVVLVLYCLRPLLGRRSRSLVAQEIESHVPALQERWSTVAELSESSDPPAIRGSERLIARVSQEAVELRSVVDPARIAGPRRLRNPALVFAGALVAFAIVAIAWPSQTGVLLKRFWAPTRPISLTQLTPLSGSQTVARGERVTLQAGMSGRLRASGEVWIRSETGEQILDLLPTAASHVFSHEIRSAEASFDYSFRAGDGATGWQRITVAERPSIAQAHYRLIAPAYSRLPREEKDTLPTRLYALQGSRLELSITPTKPLARLELKFEDGRLEALPAQGSSYLYATTLDENVTFSLLLTDELGLTNLSPPTCRITVFRDKPPTVQITAPARELAVRPDEKLPIAFEARDDLGIASAELIVTTGEGADEKVVQATPIPLGKQEGARRVRGEAELDLKPLALKHGDRLSYAVRVQDSRQASAVGERDTDVGVPRPTALAQSGSASQPALSASASTAPASEAQALAASQTQPAGAPAAGNNTAQSRPALAAAGVPGAATQLTPSQNREDRRNQNVGGSGQADAGRPRRRTASQPATEGSPRPPVDMTMRQARGSQDREHEAESRRQTLIVDKWAGSFDGQAREKLQIAIDAYLARLDAALAAAQKHTEELREPPATRPSADDAEHPPALARARSSLAEAERTVAELRAKSDDTPYAFMGLQLHNIIEAHVAPAQRHLSNVTTRPAADPASPKDYDQAWYHIVRAREELAALTQKYEEIKRQEKIAETAERVSKMHQVFVEDVMALLAQCKPTINARKNKMIEISDDFAEAVKELLEQLKKVDAELARILARDPELLRKFLDRAENTNLRDELTKLHWREEAIGQQSAIATTRPAEGGAAVTAVFSMVVASEQQDLARFSGRSHDKVGIWMPTAATAGMEGLKKAQTEMGEAARILHESAIAAAAQQLDRAADLGSKALEHLASAQTNVLAATSALPGGDDAAALFTAHRIAELERLMLEENAAIQKIQAVRLKRAGRALGLEQTQIRLATVDLAKRVARQLAFIQEISPPAVEKLDELIGILNGHIPEHEQEATIALRAERWDLAGGHVNNALEGYARAETLYDEALTLIEKALADRAEKTPPMVPQPPALEQLLEALKREKENIDKLGFAPPRLNLMIMSDWAGEGEGEGGGRGQDGQASSQQDEEQQDAAQQAAQARAEAARREAENVQQKANEAQRDTTDQRDRMLAEARKATKTQPASGDLAVGPGTGDDPAGNGRDFNVFASRLEEDITQTRGTNPPSQYKEAIESYFEVISENADREKKK